jgi:1,4-alpha-glucan branching enzyme
MELQPIVTRRDDPILGEVDLHLFNEGTHVELYRKLGAHPTIVGSERGTRFAVWAPDADEVSVVGDFNGWQEGRHRLTRRGPSGLWEGFVPGIGRGAVYKYHLRSRFRHYQVDKADPFARYGETPPRTGSIVWSDDYRWQDQAWMGARAARNALDAPMAIYEVHLGSWRRVPEEGQRSLSYRELAHRLVEHLDATAFTHVELLPVMEHPFFGSWGYQVTGFFAPSSRFGTPEDLKYLVDTLHQHGYGVIFDWVPSHFPTDEHGLIYFDGTHLYEHADPRQGHHPDWKSAIFNYGRNEVRSFLLSSAHFWLDEFHADGLRVDGVASMLYLDYSRREGEWIPNRYGGRENLEALTFLRALNGEVGRRFEGVQIIAEESTAWPGVTRRSEIGGLGFGLKWDMGWMHDTLEYMSLDPIHRRFHHDKLTFRGIYANSEKYVLPLSHDEVVHGKRSLLGKMAGDTWQKFANLRLLYAYMYGLPGKKLLFMGGEIGQWREWNHDGSLDWHLLASEQNAGLMRCVGDLNRLYRGEPALHVGDCAPEGFSWVDCNDALQSTLSFLRHGREPDDVVLVVCNFTPVPRHDYRLGVPFSGPWREILNTDARSYGGSGQGNLGGSQTAPVATHGHYQSLVLTLPPLAALYFKPAAVRQR